MQASCYITVLLSVIGERYADLRIIQPRADAAMERSMHRYGQLTPVVVGREDNGYEMVDGFKRLRGARKLGYIQLEAKVIDGGRRAMKAAIIHLNTKARTIAELEMGMVIRSLYREDMLTQVEIAVLLDRHKSFVCRRLRLVEKLNEEVLAHLKLGLINITVGRELARLPAGNQHRAFATVVKYRFTGTETYHLVNLLLQQPEWCHDGMLQNPASILTERQSDRPHHSGSHDFYGCLIKMEVILATVSEAQLNSCQPEDIMAIIARIETALAGIRKRLV
jgi:ParB/RepB/Spo0J family partition protein